MLFFIFTDRITVCTASAFQYIQCYFLSMANNVSGSFYSYFNTSNVIFYLSSVSYCSNGFVFQYIQCYFLSIIRCKHVLPLQIFQYIQCYFLSNGFKPFFNYHPSQIPLFFKVSAIFYHPQTIFSNLF